MGDAMDGDTAVGCMKGIVIEGRGGVILFLKASGYMAELSASMLFHF